MSKEIRVGLLTGGFDRPYVSGLAAALASRGVCLDVIGGQRNDHPAMHRIPNLSFLNLRGNQESDASFVTKAFRVLHYYVRLLHYAAWSRPKIFHIVWNNKIEWFDRTILTFFYKLMRKKVVLTAHNINAGTRDSSDSMINRLSLKIQYATADHIFVHTERMKSELRGDFNVDNEVITVVPFPVNDQVPETGLSCEQAKLHLGLESSERAILFFGAIRPYKGLEYLVAAFSKLLLKSEDYRLIIAGESPKETAEYLGRIRGLTAQGSSHMKIIERIEYIPDEETELYFKAADVSVLPYKNIFQSGVLFLSYRFGLPVIASDVGSFRDDIIEGTTGFICRPCDPDDLARVIEKYFESNLYRALLQHRQEIRKYAGERNSWDRLGELTCEVYRRLSPG